MRDNHYGVKQFRISEENYRILLHLKNKEGKSWNMVFEKLLKRYGRGLFEEKESAAEN